MSAEFEAIRLKPVEDPSVLPYDYYTYKPKSSRSSDPLMTKGLVVGNGGVLEAPFVS